MALLYALAEWGRRPLHVFCVDHQINPLSRQWIHSVEDHAVRVGAAYTALAWDGIKPTTGLSAAAREARHALLADAARAANIHVLCLAHTADDIAEAEAMRAQGSNVGTPRTWSPSPAWPQGRGIMLCRPLLRHRRAALRDYLRVRGLDWIDDPANESETSLRAQTRKALAGHGVQVTEPSLLPTMSQIESLMHDPEGWAELGLLRFHAAPVAALPRELSVKILAAAAVCAGGGHRVPRRHSVEAVLDRLPEGKAHTLAGARLRCGNGVIQVVREVGEMGRNPNSDEGGMWDGRFELAINARDMVASGRVRGALGEGDRRFLAGLPSDLRTVLPVLKAETGPVLAHGLSAALRPNVYDTVRGWVLPRFLRAVCRVEKETDL